MSVLYITYDGLSDPLGASQIIPYIKGISSHQDEIIVLSFEKSERAGSDYDAMKSEIEFCGIKWFPIGFTKKFGTFGKAWDLLRMYITAFFLSYKYRVRIVHARGHLPAQVAYFIKRTLKVKLLFDFRGLWVDERVDKGGWDLEKTTHRLQYKYFKRIERNLLEQSDQVVVLTEKVVNEVIRLGVCDASKVTVIPCCADFDHFLLPNSASKAEVKKMMGIPTESFVLGYLGSIGNMYLLDKILLFFKIVLSKHQNVCLLFITNDIFKVKELIAKNMPINLHSSIYVKSANRAEVPLFVSTMDIMTSFIMPSYARMAASPTKIAECFATGVPVISNNGVGDVEEIIDNLDGGKIVDPFSDEELRKASLELFKIGEKGGFRLREAARSTLSLSVANKKYKCVYNKLI
jgi:glycosyltransferase involved in cell wall biosynthesis